MPRDGETVRVMAHYYGATTTPAPVTHPMVNVYCGGVLRATCGAAPDVVSGFAAAGGPNQGLMWRVVDVTTRVAADGATTGCDTTPLHPPWLNSGYWVTNGDRTY